MGDAAPGVFGEKDVILLGAFEFDHPQVRPGPMDAVTAFGVAIDLRSGHTVGRFGVTDIRAAIVELVNVAVLDECHVAARVAFPRFIHVKDDFPRRRMVQHLPGPVERFDEGIVDEQFAAGADVERAGEQR